MIDSPDDWMRWFFFRSTGCPAFNPVAMEGRIYDEKCPECNSTTRHTTTKGVPDPLEVCGHCGTEWPFEDRQVLKAAFDIGRRPTSTEHRILPSLEVGSILERLDRQDETRWAIRVYSLRIVHPRDSRCQTGGSQYNGGLWWIASLAAEIWPSAPFVWNRDRVTKLITEGRQAFGQSLQESDLLEPGWS